MYIFDKLHLLKAVLLDTAYNIATALICNRWKIYFKKWHRLKIPYILENKYSDVKNNLVI